MEPDGRDSLTPGKSLIITFKSPACYLEMPSGAIVVLPNLNSIVMHGH